MQLREESERSAFLQIFATDAPFHSEQLIRDNAARVLLMRLNQILIQIGHNSLCWLT